MPEGLVRYPAVTKCMRDRPGHDIGIGIAAECAEEINRGGNNVSDLGYHEPYELLSQESKDMHRALKSVMEELEAIDWYQQRADVCADPELREILLHNKNEEIEHAMMGLEWIRRRNPRFSDTARTYLFSEGSIIGVEERAMGREGGGGEGGAAGGSLGIGSLRKEGI